MGYFCLLPDAIFAFILSNYLELSDILKLDSSFLNHTDRSALLSAYQQIREFSKDMEIGVNIMMARWLSRKTPNLITLNICDSDILDRDIFDIFQTSTLIKNLTISGGQFTNLGLVVILTHSPQLQTLRIMNNAFITSVQSADIFWDLDSLTSIDLCGCSSAQDHLLLFISNYCKNLISLSLGNCWSITDSGLLSIIRNCHSLEYLNLAQCSQFIDVSISQIPHYLSHLKSLDLSYCVNVSESCLTLIVRSLLSLERLNLSSCDQSTRIVYEHISQLPNLLELRLCSIMDRTSEVPLDDIVRVLSTGCTQLQYLSLAGTRISDAILNIFKDTNIFQNLKCLDFMEDNPSIYYPVPYYNISPEVVAEICAIRLNASLIRIDPERYACQRHLSFELDDEPDEDDDDIYENIVAYSQLSEYYLFSQPPADDFHDDYDSDYDVDEWDLY